MKPSNSAHQTAMALDQELLNNPTEVKDAFRTDQSSSPLLKLPAELREATWELVLTGPSLVAAYMTHRTILRNAPEPEHAQEPDQQMRAFRHVQAFPRLPTLALVCKDLAREIVVYYLQYRIFQFHIDDDNGYEVTWLEKLQEQCETLISYQFYAENYLTLRVGFSVQTHTLPEYATVEYNLAGTESDELIEVRLDGALLKECLCWVHRAIIETDDDGIIRMAEFTHWLECHIRSFWLRRNWWAASRPCLKCSLPRYGADMEAIDDEDEDQGTGRGERWLITYAETLPRCHLLSLPAELREMIRFFVLVEPEPIISYVERRTIRGRDFHYPRDSNTIRIKQPVPSLPPLACVARHLHEEVMGVFYGGNTFVFNLNTQNPFEGDSWFDALRDHSVNLMETDSDWSRGRCLLDHHITIRLEFEMPIRGSLTHPAAIEYSYSEKKHAFSVQFSGALRSSLVRITVMGTGIGTMLDR
ncbi:hypothetical protein LTR15_000503 [Elasticomyces elasticus]|nr:hypothetical protein LTR15_000503 [Elasticomyces elasticus]